MFVQPSRHRWQGVLKFSARSAISLPNGSDERSNFGNHQISDLFSAGVSVMAKFPPETRRSAVRSRILTRGIFSYPAVSKPLHGFCCNLASMCACRRRRLRLLCPTLVGWPVLPGRVQTGFSGLRSSVTPTYPDSGIFSYPAVSKPLHRFCCNLASMCACRRRRLRLLCPTLVGWPVLPGRVQTGFSGLRSPVTPTYPDSGIFSYPTVS